MIKRVKQLMGIVLASTMVVSGNVVVPNICAYAEEENANVQSGTYGTNITWTLENETLTINGAGKLTKIDGIDFPWAESDDIKILNINTGITDIGADVFYNVNNLQEVNLPDGLKSIGDWAFANSDIRRLRIPDSVESIGEYAFSCANCKKIVLPSNLKSVGVNAFSIPNSGCIYLTGNAPEIKDENWVEAPGVVGGSNVTIIYPKGNKTYTEAFKNRFANSYVNWIEEDINDMSLELEKGDAKVQSVSLDVQGKTVESNEDNGGSCNISIKILDYSGDGLMATHVYVYLKSERSNSEIKIMAEYDADTDSYVVDRSNLYDPFSEYIADTDTFRSIIVSGKVWIEKIEVESDSGKTKPLDNGYEEIIPVSSYGIVSKGSDPYVAEKPEDAKYWFNVHRTHAMYFYEPDLTIKSLADNDGEIYHETKNIFVEDGVSAIGMNNIYKANDIDGLKFKRWYCPYFDYMEDDEIYSCSCVLYPEYDRDIIVFDVRFADGQDEIVDIQKTKYEELSEDDFPVIEGYENYNWELRRDTGAIYYFMDVPDNKPDTPLKVKNSSTLSKDKITAAVDAITKAAEKTNVTVSMDNATVISKEILDAVKGKNLDVTFNSKDSSWTINGKDITSDSVDDANILITRDEENAVDSSISGIIGKRSAEKLTFGNSNEFGFKANVNLAVMNGIANNKAVLIQKNENGFAYKSSSNVNSENFNITVDNGNEGYVVYGDNGDLNSDSKIDIRDAMSSLRHVSGREDLDCVREGFADVNFDGNVNIQDLIKEIHVVSGREDNF
ncbi:MAG: leucine-rich repeat protein [Agathobacter rectalis]